MKIARFPIPWAEPILGSHVCIDNLDAKFKIEIYNKQEASCQMRSNELYPNWSQYYIQPDKLR